MKLIPTMLLTLCPLFMWAQRPDFQTMSLNSPSDLVGEWGQSHMSSINYTNPNTGSYAAPSGESTAIHFFPDGTFKEGWLLQQSTYGCTSSVFGYKAGVYEVRGTTLVMQDKEWTLTSKDNCHREWNYEKHPPLARVTFEWRLDRNQYGPVLVLHGADGKNSVYSRQQGPGLLSK